MAKYIPEIRRYRWQTIARRHAGACRTAAAGERYGYQHERMQGLFHTAAGKAAMADSFSRIGGQQKSVRNCTVAHSTFRGSRIAHFVRTSNAEAHADTKSCAGTFAYVRGSGPENHTRGIYRCLILRRNLEFARFRKVENRASSKRFPIYRHSGARPARCGNISAFGQTAPRRVFRDEDKRFVRISETPSAFSFAETRSNSTVAHRLRHARHRPERRSATRKRRRRSNNRIKTAVFLFGTFGLSLKTGKGQSAPAEIGAPQHPLRP